MSCTRLFSLLFAGALCATATAAPVWVPTNYGNGADAEVRESAFDQNRGSSTEIASRIKNAAPAGDGADGSDRNSLIYVKIDLTDHIMPDDGKTAFRMTYRNSNLNSSRVADYITPNSNFRTGLAFYGLDTTLTWDESTITYANAPGIDFPGDANIGTRDLNSSLTFLGTQTFEPMGTQNHLPIGGALTFASANLDTYVSNAIAGGATEVTIVAHTLHDGSPFFAQFNNWINFNYLFNPKEQVTLNGDSYDAGDGNGNIGNLFGTDNSTGAFSPSLLLVQVPEPTTAVLSLVALAGFAGARRRS
ncbi:hypothetical protein Pla108_18260 [Botrimarina colliarenosi]|uniref:PEP-CTERM protein-sorting domain-containing protein n=1 Tax=Botrimarina colliarenosi TaxID=2528001 RepID=A0A5C6ACD4_9BACT|nr:PEP-CTERM sorting domain-containing protein [Botrimarina colliarenosi]TWT97674.1 hypothetical protein Pla108_18260 [Botrimarina colliarenosi]